MLDKHSRRERQILDILYQRDRASAHEVKDLLPDSPSYSAVRALLRILEEKGHVWHEEQGGKYVYMPVVARAKARKTALRRLVETFFDGSAEQVVATLLDGQARTLNPEELDRMALLIERARKEAK